MKRVMQVVLMSLVAVALVAPVGAADNVKVGDFLTQIAHAKRLPATSGVAAEQALKGAGVALPSLDVNAPLTEGTVAEIAASLGINVTTSNPTAAFNESQMSTFVSSFASEIGGIDGDGNSATDSDDNDDKKPRHGHKKHKGKTRSEPD